MTVRKLWQDWRD
ncbi:Protein of unknown function [Lactobacillus delbrueckii subsp. lactis]|nr:Putative uncharacterized protein [Lactobacillus delbrueckii subsp. lactis]CDR80249.1 Protein of unknown function [Lactobacillus delbrueckii subsp. lactis]CDR82668.1 Protein of unknown function [Lactobacillus delbrueckii subsp. lactis]